MARTKTTIHLVGGVELSIVDDTTPDDAEFNIILNEIMRAMPGGTHVMDNSDVAGRHGVLRRYLLAAGDYIVGATVEEVE